DTADEEGAAANPSVASGFAFEDGRPCMRLDVAKLLPAAASDLGLWREDGARRASDVSARACESPMCEKDASVCADGAADGLSASFAALSPRACVFPPCDLSRFNPLEEGGRAEDAPRLGTCAAAFPRRMREALAQLEKASKRAERHCPLIDSCR
ncbi:MAG: hypothetical protein ACLT98_12980, partial [Eggerthellaceae bacterium]